MDALAPEEQAVVAYEIHRTYGRGLALLPVEAAPEETPEDRRRRIEREKKARWRESVAGTERDHRARQTELYRDRGLRDLIKARDGDRCRYCGGPVDWSNRRGPNGATYDHVDPYGGNTLENVVVACHRCNSAKGNRTPEDVGMSLEPVAAPGVENLLPDLLPDLLPQPNGVGPEVEKSKSGSRSPHVVTASVVASTVPELLRYYEKLFVEKHGEKPLVASGKDPAILGRILRRYGADRTRELLTTFFTTDDEFVNRTGHTIGVFLSVLNKLIVEQAQPARPALSPRTRANRDALRGFVEDVRG